MERRQFLRFAAGGIALAAIPLPGCTDNSAPVLVEGGAGALAIADDGTRFDLLPDEHSIVITAADGRTRRVGGLGRDPGQLNYPVAVATRAGLAYIVELGNHRVQAFDKTGASRGVFAAGELFYPSAIAMRGSQLFVADTANERIVELDVNGAIVRSIASELGMRPTNLATLGDHLLVVDSNHRRVVELDARGAVLRTFDGEWVLPWAVATDGDTVYIADGSRAELALFDRRARRVDTMPLDVAARYVTFASDGQLYVG